MQTLSRISTVLLFLLAIAAIHHKNWPSGLNGTWVRATSDDRQPELLTIEHKGNVASMKYFRDAGVETVTIKCDGGTHPQSQWTTDTYRAQCEDNSVAIESRYDPGTFAAAAPDVAKFAPKLVSAQDWVLSADGRNLTIRAGGDFATYRRPTVWEWFWAKIP
jgi:hypothetical protein